MLGEDGALVFWVRMLPPLLAESYPPLWGGAGGEAFACVPTFTGCDVPIFAGCDVPPCRDACNASASSDNVQLPVSCADLGEVLLDVQVRTYSQDMQIRIYGSLRTHYMRPYM